MAAGFLEPVGQEMVWKAAAERLVLTQEEREGVISTVPSTVKAFCGRLDCNLYKLLTKTKHDVSPLVFGEHKVQLCNNIFGSLKNKGRPLKNQLQFKNIKPPSTCDNQGRLSVKTKP